jgi:aminoglycoside/choline kinase family phosphotransferase
MIKKTRQDLITMFRKHFGEEVINEEMLPPSGSYREYLRIRSPHYSAIGTWNEDENENRAFIEFSKHFRSKGLNVPEIYDHDLPGGIYLQEDLGDLSLFQFTQEVRGAEGFSERIIEVYRKVIKELPKIQVIAGEDFNYGYCYPRKSFDRQSMMWDLNYFKYYFLKLAKVPFNEQLLEDDFSAFCDYLLKAESSFFMFRDFQSRNIMIRDGEPWFIDYQGGREGPLHYDLASLLYDAKADIPQYVRDELFDLYIEELNKIHPVNPNEFKQFFYGFVIIRIMQAMGAYGFRGFYEKKEHFLRSIPFALSNMNSILAKIDLPVALPELMSVLGSLKNSEVLKKIITKEIKLTIRVTSFSYKKGIPGDPSGNGGGFVFDCRSLPNPGKYKEYMAFTGRDEQVIKFLEKEIEVDKFLETVFSLVDRTVEKYLEWKFTHLSVCFGCTGGIHRSVYSAERMASHLSEKYPVRVILQHREQENL